MAINVDFYNFNKRINSTKIPSAVGQTFSCTLKDDCSILTPVIRLAGANATFKPINYNYARIADFGRYYFVNNWTFVQGCWQASLNIDELASWRADIGNSNQYILRTSSEAWNPYLSDSEYVTTTGLSSVTVEATAFPFLSTISQGAVVLGVLSSLGADVAPITYYMFTVANFRTFCENLYSDDFFEQFTQGMWNPIQYIVSCVWYPIAPVEFETIGSDKVFIGCWNIPATCGIILPTKFTKSFTISFQCSNHPQMVDRGPYMNCPPFTRRSLYWAVFGEIPIDTNMTATTNYIYVEFSVDLVSGKSIYRVRGDDKFLTSGECSIGVTVPLSQTTVDTFGLLQNMASTVGSIATGNVFSSIGNIVSGASNLVPQVRTTGSVGNFSAYLIQKPIMRSDFLSVTESDVQRFGRPYCDKSRISYMPGFLLCKNADFSATGATKTEIDTINNFMNGGFYYE